MAFRTLLIAVALGLLAGTGCRTNRSNYQPCAPAVVATTPACPAPCPTAVPPPPVAVVPR
ncbi:MAG TPA: hypothetical protein VFE62_26105 [Gemmataceae bacterium]|nr:hypothetical protein [Gemmataceae bacterium]